MKRISLRLIGMLLHLVLGVALSLGCGARRQPLPTPTQPLVAHRPIPPEPAQSVAPLTLTLPATEAFTLPCGIEVQVVTRAHALVGEVAVLGAGGGLGDGGRVEDDVVLVDLLQEAFDASVHIDERGLRLHRSELAAHTLTRATNILRALRTTRFSGEEVTRAASARTEVRAELRGPGRLSIRYDLIRRLYGSNSPQAIWENPRRRLEVVQTTRLNARFAHLVVPAHLTLVIVGPYDAALVRDTLMRVTSAWGEAQHAAPRSLAVPTFPPAHPQAVGYGVTCEMGTITLLDAGPGAFAEGHGAYRVAVRILGGMYSSRPNNIFREERRESYGAWARVSTRGGYSTLRFQMSVRQDHLNDALRLLTDELARLGRVEVLTDEEVLRARRIELGDELRRFDDAESIAKAILAVRAEGLTLDAYRRRFEAIERVTRADVAFAALNWIRPTSAPIAVMGGGTWMATHQLSAPGGFELAP